jgi:hypothetical protein
MLMAILFFLLLYLTQRDYKLKQTQQTQEMNTHSNSGTRTRDPSNRAAKTCSLAHTATGIGRRVR